MVAAQKNNFEQMVFAYCFPLSCYTKAIGADLNGMINTIYVGSSWIAVSPYASH